MWGLCSWSRPLGCGCERYPDFWVEDDEFWLEGSLLSKPKNNCYLYIGLCVFGVDLMLNLMISHRLADVICNCLIGTLVSVMICFKAFCFVCKSFHLRPFYE
jgi:hypothetical protein